MAHLIVHAVVHLVNVSQNKSRWRSNGYDGPFDDHGLPHGHGKQHFLGMGNSELYYDGEWVHGKKRGNGVLYVNNVLFYRGGWHKDLFCGSGVYEGCFSNGQFWGQGRLLHSGRFLYEGSWANGAYGGVGKRLYPDSCTYVGAWDAGKRCGQGCLRNPQGRTICEGDWKQDCLHGEGTIYGQNGEIIYRGQFANGKRDGEGCHYWANGDIVYGSFQAGSHTGYGRYCFKQNAPQLGVPAHARSGTSQWKSSYVGYWQANLLHGVGVFSKEDGAQMQVWRNGWRVWCCPELLPLIEGYLQKQGKIRKSWKERFFRVRLRTHELVENPADLVLDYFTNREHADTGRKPKGTIRISEIEFGSIKWRGDCEKSPHCFSFRVVFNDGADRTFLCFGSSAEKSRVWMKSLTVLTSALKTCKEVITSNEHRVEEICQAALSIHQELSLEKYPPEFGQTCCFMHPGKPLDDSVICSSETAAQSLLERSVDEFKKFRAGKAKPLSPSSRSSSTHAQTTDSHPSTSGKL